ncbi:MAG: hypothetical protein MJB14_11220 [Spirochaetes bacterium]|nr:hypothetical protein [Spirochaetota bacterium]
MLKNFYLKKQDKTVKIILYIKKTRLQINKIKSSGKFKYKSMCFKAEKEKQKYLDNYLKKLAKKGYVEEPLNSEDSNLILKETV